MSKLLLPAILAFLLALNVAAFTFIAAELDGSTVSTKRTLTGPEPSR
jgi:hypothetical protein